MAAVERRGMVVLGVSGRLGGCILAGGVESGGIRIRERGDSTVVFGAGGEVTKELVGYQRGAARGRAVRWQCVQVSIRRTARY